MGRPSSVFGPVDASGLPGAMLNSLFSGSTPKQSDSSDLSAHW